MRSGGGDFPHDTITTLRSTKRPWYRRKWVWIVTAVLVLIIIIVATVVPSQKKVAAAQSSSQEYPVQPVPEVSSEVLQAQKEEFGNTLLTYYNTYQLDWSTVVADGTPQSKALLWVAGSANFPNLDGPQRIQRFVLATLYYATFRVEHENWNAGRGDDIGGWTSSVNWITPTSECEWEGIGCENEAVTGIILREHRLGGELPLELAFISTSLKTLDLTTNFVLINGDAQQTPFTHLDVLETLLLEDNYVISSTGVPSSLSAMTSLQKLVLSYNILEGPLDGTTFGKLSKLTHLEIESNFINGGVPSEILALPDLVYVYLRSNWMTIDLSTMLGNGTLPSLFALWIDDNTVPGPIPPTIADKVDLASISITNATLGGNIPTELGQLTDLQRIWLYMNSLQGVIPTELASLSGLEVLELYDNNLTGQMPPGICSTIASKDYAFRALTADCADVKCDNCCTQCY